MACSLHVNDNLLQLLINNNILLEVVVRCPLQDELFQANNHRYISLLSNGNLNLRPWAHPVATFSPTYITVDQPCTSPRVTIYTLVYTGKLKVRVLLLFHVVGWHRLTNQEICLLRCIQKLNTSPVFFSIQYGFKSHVSISLSKSLTPMANRHPKHNIRFNAIRNYMSYKHNRCLFQNSTLVSHVTWRGLFYIQWVKERDHCSCFILVDLLTFTVQTLFSY